MPTSRSLLTTYYLLLTTYYLLLTALQVEFINRANLRITARSEEFIADWTLPEAITPILSRGPTDNDGVVPRGLQPPGSSPYGGIRAFNWVGSDLRSLTIGHNETHCDDPESGAYSMMLLLTTDY